MSDKTILNRALHQLQIMRKELEFVHRDIACRQPEIDLTGNVITGTMACRARPRRAL